jgi:hypothetical protein
VHGDCSAQWLAVDRALDEMRRKIDAWEPTTEEPVGERSSAGVSS